MKLGDMKVGVKFVRVNKLTDECKSEYCCVTISITHCEKKAIVPWMRESIQDKVKNMANENEACIPYHIWYEGDVT